MIITLPPGKKYVEKKIKVHAFAQNCYFANYHPVSFRVAVRGLL